MALIQQSRMLGPKDLWTNPIAHGVVDKVPQACSADEEHDQERQIERRVRTRGQSANGEQERISRQERCDHQPSFAKHNQEQHKIKPTTQRTDKGIEVHVEVDEQIHGLLQYVHAWSQVCQPPRACWSYSAPSMEVNPAYPVHSIPQDQFPGQALAVAVGGLYKGSIWEKQKRRKSAAVQRSHFWTAAFFR